MQLLVSRYAYQTSLSFLRENNLPEAEIALAKALDSLPGSEHSIFLNDLLRIALSFGDLYVQESLTITDPNKLFETLKLAEIFYQLAVEISSLEIRAVSGLATTRAALLLLSSQNEPQGERTDVKSLFEKAMVLRPNGISIRYQYMRYLANQKKGVDLTQTVTRLAAIYPPSYTSLKKEPFFSQNIRQAFKKGLSQAIKEGKFRREAYSTQSNIAIEENKLELAIRHYKEFLAVYPQKNSYWQYLHLGGLYLKAGKEGEAQEQFLKGLLLASDRERALHEIYANYDLGEMYQPFLLFVKKAEETIPMPDLIHILAANSFIKLKQEVLAQARLARVDTGKYGAESYYLRAIIAEMAEDWSAMEIAIQRATVLDPKSSKYRVLFSRALHRQKKYERAEEEATRAISISTKQNHWLFNHRGWIRWNRKDFNGAIRDWKRASNIKPDNAEFYYQLSLAYKRVKNKPAAIRYIKNALEIDPENRQYQKHLKRL